ncbi:MAG: barstar family protein [Ruthenibacterium sp.]
MKQIILDGMKMHDEVGTQKYLKKALAAGDYYGENLDALYDILTEITAPTRIVFINEAAAQAQIGRYADKVISVLRDAAKANDVLMTERI